MILIKILLDGVSLFIGSVPDAFGINVADQPNWGAACSWEYANNFFDNETRTFEDLNFTVTATSNKAIPITYSIADTSIATIDGSSGEITIKKPEFYSDCKSRRWCLYFR